MHEWIKRNERLFLMICMICGGVSGATIWAVVSLFLLTLLGTVLFT